MLYVIVGCGCYNVAVVAIVVPICVILVVVVTILGVLHLKQQQ